MPRVLLVGDAVGADPIFGEGISMALGYGVLAATEIACLYQRGEFSFDRYKRRLVRSGLVLNIIRALAHYSNHLHVKMADGFKSCFGVF